MTTEQINQVVTLRRQGWTLQQVAELFNTDRISIRKIESNYYKGANNG